MALSLDRQNGYRERYRRARPDWRPATEVYESLIRERVRSGVRVLDLGCGRGGVLEQLGAAIDQPIGIDPDARSLVEHRLRDLPRAAATADAIPLQAASVDCIVCSWVLEHVADPQRVFSEVARCLRPNGAFIFLTPNARSLISLINRALRPVQHTLVPRLYGRTEADTFPVLYRANSKARLDQLAERAGLMPDRFYQIPDPSYLAFTPALYTLSVLLSRRTPPVHLTGVYRRRST